MLCAAQVRVRPAPYPETVTLMTALSIDVPCGVASRHMIGLQPRHTLSTSTPRLQAKFPVPTEPAAGAPKSWDRLRVPQFVLARQTEPPTGA